MIPIPLDLLLVCFRWMYVLLRCFLSAEMNSTRHVFHFLRSFGRSKDRKRRDCIASCVLLERFDTNEIDCILISSYRLLIGPLSHCHLFFVFFQDGRESSATKSMRPVPTKRVTSATTVANASWVSKTSTATTSSSATVPRHVDLLANIARLPLYSGVARTMWPA